MGRPSPNWTCHRHISRCCIFPRVMESVLNGIPGVVVYLDNIFITGPTNEAHLGNIRGGSAET